MPSSLLYAETTVIHSRDCCNIYRDTESARERAVKMYGERRLTKFLIMFDNSNLLYFPGQFLAGRVIVELQEEMAITGLARTDFTLLSPTP